MEEPPYFEAASIRRALQFDDDDDHIDAPSVSRLSLDQSLRRDGRREETV